MMETRTADNFAAEQHRLHERMKALLDGADKDGRQLNGTEEGEYRTLEKALDESLEKAQAAAKNAKMREALDGKRALAAGLVDEERRSRSNPQAASRGGSIGSSVGSIPGERRTLAAISESEGIFGALDSPEYRSRFADVIRCRADARALHAEMPELRTITTATSNAAIPTIMQNRIVELMQPLSPLFDLLTKLPAPEVGSVPVEATIGSAAWVADGSPVTLGDPTQTLKPIVAKSLGTGVAASRTMIDANAFPLEEYLSKKLAMRLRNGFELGALRGSGTGNEPKGILTDIAANYAGQIQAGGVVGSLTGDNFIDCEFKIPAEYRNGGSFQWLISDAALKEVRKLKDTTGQYLWKLADSGDLKLGIPGTINGYPYRVSGYFEAAATTKPCAILGNWEYFECYLRNSMDLFVDPYTASASRVVNFYAWMRMDFLLTVSQAFGVLRYG